MLIKAKKQQKEISKSEEQTWWLKVYVISKC